MKEEIVFRRAEARDLERVVAMLADDPLGATRERPGPPLDPAYARAFAAIDADPNQILMVAEQGGAVVGTLQISLMRTLARLGALRGQIEAVRVARGHRGAGLGRRMFEWAIAECAARGCVLAQLTSDKTRPEAHGFYESLGFTASHEGYKLKLQESS